MKKRLSIVCLFMLVAFSTEAQGTSGHDSTRYFCIKPTVGYTTFALDDVRDFYKQVLYEYRLLGVDVPTQQEYPGNIIFGIMGMYNIPNVLRIGLGSQYTWSKAYSGYEDYAGLLEVHSKITMATLEVFLERDVESTPTVNIFFGASGGFSFVKSKYSNTISLNDYPSETGTVSLNGDGHGYCFQGYVGLDKLFNKKIIIGITAGYRLALIKEIDGKMTIPGEGTFSGKLDLEHDMSGVVLNARIGYRFSSR